MSAVQDAIDQLDAKQTEVFDLIFANTEGCDDALVADFLGPHITGPDVAVYRKNRI